MLLSTRNGWNGCETDVIDHKFDAKLILMLCNASGLVSGGFWLTVLCGTDVAMK